MKRSFWTTRVNLNLALNQVEHRLCLNNGALSLPYDGL